MDNVDELYPEEKKETWRATLKVLNDHFMSRLDENVFEGVRDEMIYHGLKVTALTILQKTFTDVCFCRETQEYLVLDKGIEMQRFSMQGKLLHPPFSLAADSFTRMFWCNEAKCLVCYESNNEYIRFLSSSCATIRTISNEFPVRAIYYEPMNNEIIVLGSHNVIKYILNFAEEEIDPSTKPMRYSDPEYGATWEVECSALVNDSSVKTQLVGSYSTIIYLMPLEIDEDMEVDGSVEFLGKLPNASKANITVIHFHESTSWIIIGDQQGNVTAWNLRFECMMSHIAAHNDQVMGIVKHPMICGFLTYSQSKATGMNKLQVWSCNFRSAIEDFTDFGDIYGIEINPLAAAVVVLSAKLRFFTMHQLYYFYAPLTGQAVNLHVSKNPMYLKKLTVACKDNIVRIFDANGKQLNILILSDKSLKIEFAGFSGMQKKLITKISTIGDILVSDASIYPMKFRHVIINDGPQITCMAIYEFYDEIRDSEGRRRKPRLFNPIRVLIIVGTVEGELIVINDETGQRESIYQAHEGSVMLVQASSVWRQAISLGIDRCVKVWRIFADLPKALVIYYTLYFIEPITHVSFIRDTLCIINSSRNSKVHQVLMENMTKKVRLQHEPSKEHTAPILTVMVSENLELFATSSLDKTIRIWDNENSLIKILEINTQATNMVFSSLRGDIVFAAGRHLYRIPYENYLPPKYRAKIVARNIVQEEEEISAIPTEDDSQNLMLYPISSMPLGCIDITDSENTKVEHLLMKQKCAINSYRDQDILQMKDNFISPKSIIKSRELMTADVWEKYIIDFLKNMSPPSLEPLKYDFGNLFKTKSREKRSHNVPGVFRMLFGYSINEVESIENLKDLIRNSRLPLRGFLPNSILYKPWEPAPKPPEVVREKIKRKPVKYQYPPEFYPEERPSEGQVSIRLSQLMAQTTEGEEKAG